MMRFCSPAAARLRAFFRRLGTLAVVLAMVGCDSPPIPDEPREAVVLDAPILLATPQGERLYLLTEQSLRRTERSHRTTLGYTQEVRTTHSVIRDELWMLDPATLAVAWRQPLREYRPTGTTLEARLLGGRADAIWWRADGIAAVSTTDGEALPGAGAPPPDSRPVESFNAPWYFHAGAADGEGGALRFPETGQVLRASDPDGDYYLQIPPVGAASPGPLRLQRRAEGGRTLWTLTLPVAALHSLAATDTHLVFFGSTDGGKVPGTQHDAVGRHLLVSIDIRSGQATTLDVGEASLLAPVPPAR